jgi:hypothetical protein
VVPPWRFALFSTLTVGVYVLYWFWKNWSLIKRRDGSDIWPAARTLFATFTYFSLITDINTRLALRGSTRQLSTTVGVGFLIANTLYRLPEPYDVLSFASFVFLLPAVSAIEELASTTAIDEARWAPRHTLALVGSSVFFALVMVGKFVLG